MNTPAFSVVVLTRNEAHKLPALFASLQFFLTAGGECVVVDTGSVDDTVQVAREAGARVVEVGERFHSRLSRRRAAEIKARFSRRGEGPLARAGAKLFDFGSARQFAGTLASNDVAWHIDASDVVLSADLEFLDAHVRTGRVRCFDYFLGLGESNFRVARFFDRRLYTWTGRVHEVPLLTGPDPGPDHRVSCNEAQLSLRHIGSDKVRNYLPGLALDTIEDRARPRWGHFLGRQLYAERFYHSAVPVLRRHARDRRARAAERAQSLCLVGMCQEALRQPDRAAASYFQASQIDPSRRLPMLKLATLAQARGHFHGSVAFAAAALTLPAGNPFFDANDTRPVDPHALLYWGLFWLGRRDEAKVHWDICRETAPDDETYVEHARFFAGDPARAT